MSAATDTITYVVTGIISNYSTADLFETTDPAEAVEIAQRKMEGTVYVVEEDGTRTRVWGRVYGSGRTAQDDRYGWIVA